MRWQTLLFLAALPLTGCNRGLEHEAAVRATFDSFQRALFAGDRAALWDLLSRSSRPALEHIDTGRLHGRERLVVTGVERVHGRYHLSVHEPGRPEHSGVYVVVREDSFWRVDLLQSLAGTHGTRRDPEQPPIFVPAGLDTAELGRIQATPAVRIR